MKIEGPIPEHILKRMNKEDRPDGIPGMTRSEIDQKNEIKSERQIQNQIYNYLTLLGIVFYNARMDKRSTIGVGLPDFAFAFHGVPVALEVKALTGKVTEEQNKCQLKMSLNGWQVYVVQSLSQVKIILESICKRNLPT